MQAISLTAPKYSTQFLQHLTSALGHEDNLVRHAAVVALDNRSDSRDDAISALLAAMANEPGEFVGKAAKQTLRNSGPGVHGDSFSRVRSSLAVADHGP